MKRSRVLANGILATALIAVVAAVMTLSGPASGQATFSEPWTQIGSAGAIDEADGSIYRVAGIKLEATSSAPRTAVDARYNVVAVGSLIGPGAKEMVVRFADNGAGGRVVVTLKSTNLDNGVTSTLLTLDSDDFPAASTAQARRVFDCDLAFDFVHNVYWIEANLIRSSSSGVAALLGMRVGPLVCT